MQIPFRKHLRRLKRSLARTEPLITIRISRENLLHNLRAYKEAYPGLGIAPVLKSNAYGHGLAVIAELLDDQDIAFFMVDSLYEARVLRRAGIRTRIVVMGYVRPEQIAHSRLRDTHYAITDIEQLRLLSEILRKPASIHLKIDTGMHRQGILPGDLAEAIGLIRANAHIRIVGVATHLADADNTETSFTEEQLTQWAAAVRVLKEAFPDIEHLHAAATKGASWSASYPMTVARVGMGLYGYDTSPGSALALKPVLEMRSFVTSLREIPPGESVGYNATFTATRPSIIATIPAGYYEGVDRALSGIGSLQVNGDPAPIRGRVSMNMVSLDVTDLPGVRRGDPVTLLSRSPEDLNSALGMAGLAGTTPYVILAHIPAHLYRVVE